MKKTLLKINNMKRFTRWLDQNNVHLEIIRTYFDTPWLMWPNERKSIERRLESTDQRDKFCKNKAKLRPSWRNCDVGRYGQYQKANKLLMYVKLRYDRKKKKL